VILRLERQGGEHPLVVNFMNCYKEIGSVNGVRNLAGTVIWVPEDFSTAMRKEG